MAWAESVGDERALERVHEATELSGVEARDQVQLERGSWVGERGWRHPWSLAPLGGGNMVCWERDRQSREY